MEVVVLEGSQSHVLCQVRVRPGDDVAGISGMYYITET